MKRKKIPFKGVEEAMMVMSRILNDLELDHAPANDCVELQLCACMTLQCFLVFYGNEMGVVRVLYIYIYIYIYI